MTTSLDGHDPEHGEPATLGPGGVTIDSIGESPRWTLNRAGIINVYQYENETLWFGGGRLILRGVNGSGKSTAMNMLLPFLLTARLSRIDAAGEQTGVLKSWMLAGRDEPQPVGYLWIEFERSGHHLVCGCGVKANRSTDTIRTWWFVTDRQPGVDLELVEAGVPVSVDALRSELGSDAVFSHDRRRDYRAEVARRLFGGADLDQHIRLLNSVRNPRVGDRIDVDLPAHLTGALPELTEAALTDAAKPLDDLDEHRRNVAALSETSEALTAIATVYQGYVVTDLQARIDAGRSHLSTVAGLDATVARLTEALESTRGRKEAAAAEISELDTESQRLSEEIASLKASSAYTDGQQLEDLRAHVTDLEGRVAEHRAQCEQLEVRQATSAEDVATAEALTDRRLDELATVFEALTGMTAAVGLAARPPSPPTLERAVLTGEVAEPVAELDAEQLARAVGELRATAKLRSGDVAEIQDLIARVETAVAELRAAETARDDHRRDVEEAEAVFGRARSRVSAANEAWDRSVERWAGEILPDFELDGLSAPTIGRRAAPPSTDPWTGSGSTDRRSIRQGLAAEIEELVVHRQRRVAVAEAAVHEAELLVEEAAARVDELAGLTEPDAPALPWQRRTQPCLADLVDFADHVSPADRAGIEGALQASGLLQATVTTAGLELADGDLILTRPDQLVPIGDGSASIDRPSVPTPLSDLLIVTVPEAQRERIDPEHVRRILTTVSTEPDTATELFIGVDGSFRLADLRGRHEKPEAQYIGATARRATLERLRGEAASALAAAEAELARGTAEHEWSCAAQMAAEQARRELPDLVEVERARIEVDHAEESLAAKRARLDESEERVTAADQRYVLQSDERDRVAATYDLPTDRDALDDVTATLTEVDSACVQAGQVIQLAVNARHGWAKDVRIWRQVATDLGEARSAHDRAHADYERRATRLATLEDTQGTAYRDVLADIATSEHDLETITEQLPAIHRRREQDIAAEAKTDAELAAATESLADAERASIGRLRSLQAALDVPGLVASLDPDAGPRIVEAVEASSAGLAALLDQVAGWLPPTRIASTTADGVRISLRQRRDALGAGWDAEDRQPAPDLPLAVHVDGPLGSMALIDALGAAKARLGHLTALLTTQQDDALRNLLQGLVAKEVAEKMHRAGRLVDQMNEHLVKVKTAHGLGVELRWRRRAEVDGVPTTMIDLLAKLPDLRTEDEERDLRAMLAARLDDARVLNPEATYRELIAETLDYRRWYDMTVLTRWGDAAPSRLGRDNRFSEGEKKIVTYLPFLAAVAVSCDALAEYTPDVPRFVLLDDAMAKVSEDNHGDLLGLLVDLDLDFIATSERLWGTHRSVPELAITEVIRDADVGVILLEHARWDGHTLTRADDEPALGR